ncbi:TPA: integrase [Escherichia coli]|nr:integrase [Escherichia coli]
MLNFMTLITWLHHETIEVQLAHANGGSVRGIYNHAQYLDKRREMMQWWADWLDSLISVHPAK